MKADLVSVIIPVYNVENYVELAINSIIKQSYENLEIIVVDDCSTDSTYKKIQKLSEIDPRIHLYKNKKNLGVSQTLNFALSKVKGKYVVRMDGDDISALDRIEKKIDFLEKNPNIQLVGCSLTAINPSGEIIGRSNYYKSQILISKTCKYATPVSHVWAARTWVYERLGGYRDISGVEDYDFLLRMKSMSLKFSNLEDYYGYFVRLGREGNTLSTKGLIQLKARRYAHSLYLQRSKRGFDNFSITNMQYETKCSAYEKYLYKISSLALYKAIENRSQKNYIKMILYLALTVVSLHQVRYLVERIQLRLLVMAYNK